MGLVLRSIGKGAMAPTPFIVVAMVANGVLLGGLEDVVRGCWWVGSERRGGREQEGEPAGVHESAHVPHQALVRETR